MENTKIFAGKAEAYDSARPGYAKELIDLLAKRLSLGKNSVVADVGSGTGKFTASMIDIGCRVFAVEPEEGMRAAAEELLGGKEGFVSVNGNASETTLPENSVDHVTAAAAFHWFNADEFKAECKRIVRPGGYAVLLWNVRNMSDSVVAESAELCRRFCLGFQGFSANIDQRRDIIEGFFDRGFEIAEFPNDLFFDREKFVDRMMSSSYAPMRGSVGAYEFICALEVFFDRRAENGVLRIANSSRAYIGRV